jgi:hypothetical protein
LKGGNAIDNDRTVIRLRPEPTVVAVVRRRELAIGVGLDRFLCAALTNKKVRCLNPVEMHGQVGVWDDKHRYNVDQQAAFWTATYGSENRLWCAYERQRCLVHLDRENPDAVPLDVWDLGPA